MTCAVSSCPHWSAAAQGCSLEEPGRLAPSPGRSLVLASLEIGRTLADRGRTTFRAQGTCMLPTVRPGDVLHLESRTVEQVAVGDIAVCRRPGYLFSHRVIRKEAEDGHPYIVTRPDRSAGGDDGATYDQDVLGIVTAIERTGQRLPTQPQPVSGLAWVGLVARLRLHEWHLGARVGLIRALAGVQRGPLYRRLARLWLAATRAPFDL